jgi:polyphenol oxidase
VREMLGLGPVQWLTQVHGSHWLEAGADTVGTAPEADAAWTRQRNLGLAVLTADCVPVVICDRAATVVAVAHGGWRGLVGGVLGNLVAALPARPRDLVAWLGPAIGPLAYEVGKDVADAVSALPDGRALAAACLQPAAAAGKHYLDLFALSEGLLAASGVSAVTTERLCTFSDRRFYSYRRDGSTGRMATLAWLPDPG